MILVGMTLTADPAFASVAEDVAADLADVRVQNPSITWALYSKEHEVLYPRAMAGEWRVSAKLKNVSFPLGQDYISKDVPGVTKASMIAALPDVGSGLESAVTYSAKFDAVKQGSVPDRVHNQQQLADAFLGYAAVQRVDYDRSKNPTRFAVIYRTPRRNQTEQSSDLRKAELFVNNCRFETNGSQFFSTEAVRQVNQARQSGFVYDYAVLQRFTGIGSDSLQGDMRVAAYLTPASPGFFRAQGQAVALYDYGLSFERIR